MKKLLSFLTFGMSLVSATGANLYVSASAEAGGDGTIQKPMNSLSAAIDVAQEGDVIYLTEGRYTPAVGEIPRESTFWLVSKTVSIYGGYNDKFSEVVGYSLLSADLNNNDVYDEKTGIIISNYEDNCARVLIINKNEGTVKLKNLKIQGGYADLTDKKYDTGGGAYIGSPVEMENCIVTGNYCSNSAGGGGLCVKGNFSADKCQFTGNWGAGDGGALYIKGDINISITNCGFSYNKSTSGSAFFLSNALSMYVGSNTFEGNISQTYGTATIYNKNFANKVNFINNTFANNIVTGNNTGKTLLGGSGIYAYMGATGIANLLNNTMIGNYVEGYDAENNPTSQIGGALYVRQGTAVLANNVIAGNTSVSKIGDLYKDNAGVVTNKKYNFFTSGDNMNVYAGYDDILADENSYDKGIVRIPEVFDCTYNNGRIIANSKNNGGPTNTVAVIGANIQFDGMCVASVPASNLNGETLSMDVNNTGANSGMLSIDQRGAERNMSGKAYMGAFEFNMNFSNIEGLTSNAELDVQFTGKSLHVNGCGTFTYSVISISGQNVMSGNACNSIDLSAIHPGIYLAIIKAGTSSKVVKISL